MQMRQWGSETGWVLLFRVIGLRLNLGASIIPYVVLGAASYSYTTKDPKALF